MPDPTLDDAIREAYASAPADEVILNTLELRHPTFLDEEGQPMAVRVVCDQKDLVARLEDSAPMNAGEAVTFIAVAFQMTLPPIETVAVPELDLAVDNVSTELMKYLDAAVQDPNPIACTYRPYLAGDPLTPRMDPPPTFELRDVKANVMRVTGRCRVGIDLQRAFPMPLYTTGAFPGLVNR